MSKVLTNDLVYVISIEKSLHYHDLIAPSIILFDLLFDLGRCTPV